MKAPSMMRGTKGQVKILKSSAAIRKAIGELMAPGGRRRVAITAFVGEGARAFIRNPHGVQIICWPRAGGTNPLELRRLKKAGAHIRFADRLHMKVYWAAKRGAVVGSANLSTNALGAGGLKEFGVLLPPGSIQIDDLIDSLKCRPFNAGEMEQLERAHRKQNRVWNARGKNEVISYREWFHLPARPDWKLGWWDSSGAAARNAKEVAEKEFGRRAPHAFISCKRNDYRESDWVLSFRLAKRGASTASWIYVDRVVPVSRHDKRAYDEDYPYQAFQVWAPRHYPQPPFTITRTFRKAFGRASVTFGVTKLQKLRSLRPPHRLLAMINRRMAT